MLIINRKLCSNRNTWRIQDTESHHVWVEKPIPKIVGYEGVNMGKETLLVAKNFQTLIDLHFPWNLTAW